MVKESGRREDGGMQKEGKFSCIGAELLYFSHLWCRMLGCCTITGGVPEVGDLRSFEQGVFGDLTTMP